jgi:hypothetical protein
MIGAVGTALLIAIELVLIGLAAIGVWALAAPRHDERRRIARRVRQAEADITDVGRRAQAVIMTQMLQRLHEPPSGGSDADRQGRL